MPSPGHTRVNRLSEGDVVSIWVGDHQCLHLVARRPLPGVDAELVELHYLIVDAAYSKCDGARTRTCREVADLQPSASFELPLGDLWHGPRIGWLLEYLFVPPNNAQLRQQMSGTVLRLAQASEISQVRVADLIEHLTRHFCFVTLVFDRS